MILKLVRMNFKQILLWMVELDLLQGEGYKQTALIPTAIYYTKPDKLTISEL